MLTSSCLEMAPSSVSAMRKLWKAPSVRAFVEASMGVSPRSTVNPDEAVALGCAVHAAYLSAGDDEVEDDAVVAVEHWQGALLRALARDL